MVNRHICLFCGKEGVVLRQMYEIAEDQGINIRWCDFVPPIRGMYWAPGDVPPVIFLDNSLEKNTPLLRSVMAEELGHHFTLENNCLCRTYFNCRDKLALSRAEFRAWKWAANYLMPVGRLKKAIRNGCREVWELADYFNVTEEMVRFRTGLRD